VPLTFSRGFAKSTTHATFIVEDDPVMARLLCDLVESLGHEWMLATTLEEARLGSAHGGFCYALLDMQIPATDGAPPMVACGETVLRALREKFPARTARGRHVLPIIVITSYSREPEFVTRMLKMDANDFVAKPIASQHVVPDKVREALAAAEREDHAACERAPGPSARPAPTAIRGGPGLVIDGEKNGRRTGMLVHGERRELQDAKFVALMRMVVSRLDTPGAWLGKEAMGIGHAPETPSRIRKELRGLLLDGDDVVETDKGGRVRLNPKVTVEVRWDRLLDHPEAVVQRMARERLKKE
jgi:CheY-like chemotaxis protein